MKNNLTLDDIKINLSNKFCLSLLKVAVDKPRYYPHIYFNYKDIHEREKIVNAFINTCEKNGRKVMLIEAFDIKSKDILYANIDCLVITNIEVIGQDEVSQKILIDIINQVQKKELQIIISGEKEIKEYDFEELLKSKLSNGVRVGVFDEDIL